MGCFLKLWNQVKNLLLRQLPIKYCLNSRSTNYVYNLNFKNTKRISFDMLWKIVSAEGRINEFRSKLSFYLKKKSRWANIKLVCLSFFFLLFFSFFGFFTPWLVCKINHFIEMKLKNSIVVCNCYRFVDRPSER